MPIDEDLNKGLAFLMSQKEDKGVSLNPLSRGGKVRRDDAGSDLKRLLKVEATLKSNEVARYTKIAQIFKKVLLPKEEAARLESAEKKVKLPVTTPKAAAVKKGEDGWFKKILGPAALLLGGLGALVAGLMSDGQVKGFLKILAKAGIGGGVKLLSGTFAKMGKFVGGIIKNLGGILLKPFKFLKGGKIMGVIGKVAGKLFKFLKPVLKRIPGIGSLISWAFAVSRFKKGDVVGGLIDVASGIATLFPGVGTAIGIGLDVLNAFLDMKKGGEEGVKPAGSGFSIGDFFGKVKDKIMNNFPIKNLVEFWSGVGMVMSGNFKEGFQKMAFAIPFMKPLSDWLFGAPDAETGERGGGALAKAGNMMKTLRTSMAKKMISMLPDKIMGFSIRARLGKMFGIDMGAIDDDEMQEQNAAEDKRVAPMKRAQAKYGRRKGEVSMAEIKKAAGLNTAVTSELAAVEKAYGALTAKRQALFKTHADNKPGWFGHSQAEANAIRAAEAEYNVANLNYQKAQRALRDKAKSSEMQDFIVENGTVMPFSDKDSVLGMKKGGAIDNLINQGSVEIKKLNQQLVTLAAEQTQLLREIAFNTKASKAPLSNTIVQGGGQQSAPRRRNIRDGFTSAYK